MISEDIRAFAADFDKTLAQLMPPVDQEAVILDESMRYSLLGGGKRLRPMLMAATFEAYSDSDWQEDRLVPSFMTALEMIHTCSLVHDDLPAMDDDDLRRGRRTNHIVYGEDMAILAGDGLLNGAYELMSEVIRTETEAGEHEAAARGVKAMSVIARCTGNCGMIAGQVIDVTQRANKLSRVIDMYEKKTGALLAAALVCGAILGGASQEDQDTLYKVAMQTGVSFQIRDDILDITGDVEQTGKPVGSDEERDQITYVSLRGLEQAQADVEQYTSEALAGLQQPSGHMEVVEKILRGLIGRQA